MTAPERLFGIPGAEVLYLDLASAYEAEIDPWVDELEHRPTVLEEWTVAPPANHLPPAERLLDWLVEWVADNGDVAEGYYDELENVVGNAEVLSAAEEFRDAVARRMTFRMADRLVAEHPVTWDATGNPLVDGERLYHRAPA